MSLLEAQSLVLGYEGRVVVSDLNFKVESGDYFCIIGENGSGKSTLMKTILGLRTPMSGSIITGDGLLANEIGYLPQQTVVQRDFPASVWEIVLSGLLNHRGIRPFYSKEEKAIAKANLERLGILDLKKECYRDLSGGQQQRVLLARALCATSKVLLLDEPVTGLDPMVTNEMYELIADLNKDGITIIMISHDIQATLKYATKILHVSDKPKLFMSKEEYLNSEAGSWLNDKQEREGE